jgi:addiction module HigA family antidote
MKNPHHPGELIRTEIIEASGLSISGAADVLKVRRATLSDMALRIEKAFGVDMAHLLQMQVAYDVAQFRKRKGVNIKRYHPA